MNVETEIKDSSAESAKGLKLKFAVKLVGFLAATLSLSLIFEGWRQINQSPSSAHWALLLVAIVLTTFLLWVQAFWIYIEEKSKGTLKRRVSHFDKLESLFVQASPIPYGDSDTETNVAARHRCANPRGDSAAGTDGVLIRDIERVDAARSSVVASVCLRGDSAEGADGALIRDIERVDAARSSVVASVCPRGDSAEGADGAPIKGVED